MFRKVIFLLLFCSATCDAGTMDPSVADQKYLDYGSKHECVVPIYGRCECGKQKESHDFHASAVVISSRWAVTAAHVIHNTSGVKVKVKGKEHEATRVILNKNYMKGTFGTYDIALCEFGEDVGLDFYPDLYVGDDEVGKVAGICGYGAIGTFNTGWTRSDGRKRAGANLVSGSYNHVLLCKAKGDKRTNMEFLIAPGDSGGGMFIDGKLAGINSFVMTDDGRSNSDWGDEAGHTRVSLFVPWIRAHMRGEEVDDDIK